jgi:hypothetical protein
LKRRMYPLGALSNANGFFGDDADILGRLICPRGPLRIWQRRRPRSVLVSRWCRKTCCVGLHPMTREPTFSLDWV